MAAGVRVARISLAIAASMPSPGMCWQIGCAAAMPVFWHMYSGIRVPRRAW